MSKFCKNCGNELANNETMCTKCGSKVESSASAQSTVSGSVPINKRDIATAVILSIVTCGIYGIYWFICLTDDVNTASGKSNETSGGMAFLFTLLTCGIYSIYWSYRMGQKMTEAGKLHGKDIEDRSVLYLVLSIFGLGIVDYCLIQNDLNSFANE